MKTTLLCISLSVFMLAGGQALEWNQWRGPDRDGTVSGDAWPADLGSLTERWQADLAEGYSSPIIADGVVYTVETAKKEREIVRAFDTTSGEQLWEADWLGAMKVPFFANRNGSWVRSTPALLSDGLLVGGIRDVVVKLDPKSGTEKWRIDFMEREGTELPAFGLACSPLVDGDSFYVQAGCAVTKVDAATGETLWRAMENRQAMFGSAFSSPVIATIHGKRQLVAQTRSEMGGLDLETGEVLWSTPVKAFRGMNILTPLVIGNQIFTATYGGGSTLFNVEKEGETFSIVPAWQMEKLEGYMSSPVLVGDHIYLFARDQHFYCLNVKTGEQAWKSKEKFGEYWSMLVNVDQILALDQKGELLLIAASPDALNILDRKKVSKQETWAHLGTDGDALYVRGLKELKVFDWE